MNNNNRNVENTFSYYARIVMLIIMSIEFILSIVFLGVIAEFKSNEKSQYQAICATFSLNFISFFFFVIEFIAYCTCNRETCNYENIRLILYNHNHFISLITFLICQFLYFVNCCIIPIYLSEEYYEKPKKKYTSLVVVAYIFLCIIIFLDIIILNLYRMICCNMINICKKTKECCENFGKWFVDVLCCRICNKEASSVEITTLEEEKKKQNEKISDLTGEIKHLLAKNINFYYINENNN